MFIKNVITAENNFNNQVDRLAYQWIVVSFFSQSLLPLLNGFMNKVVIVAWIEVINGLSNMDFNSSKITASKTTKLQPLLSAQSSSSTDQKWIPNMAPFPGMISQLRTGKLITWAISITEGAALCSVWHLTEYWFICSAHNSSIKTTTHGLVSIPGSIVSHQWSDDHFLNHRLRLAVCLWPLNLPVLSCFPSFSIGCLVGTELWPFEDSLTVAVFSMRLYIF